MDHLRGLALDRAGTFAYFSIGSKEKRGPQPILKTVQDNMGACADILASAGCETMLNVGPGNHMQHVPERMAAGIAALDGFLSREE